MVAEEAVEAEAAAEVEEEVVVEEEAVEVEAVVAEVGGTMVVTDTATAVADGDADGEVGVAMEDTVDITRGPIGGTIPSTIPLPTNHQPLTRAVV